MDWRRSAACRDEDPSLFFPIGDSGPALKQIAEAKAVCARCPVRTQCGDMAVEAGLDHGIFGGLTEDERRKSRYEQLLNRPHLLKVKTDPAKPAPRVPLVHDGVVVAAPDADSMGDVWGNASKMKRHAAATDGRALCKPSITLDLRRGQPCNEVAEKQRCRHQLCRRAFETADQQGCKPMESLPSNT